nr:hypothetical protein [Rhodococcus pyridinivorans]
MILADALHPFDEFVAGLNLDRVDTLVGSFLSVECGFEHGLRQLPEQSVLAHQLDALFLGLGQ